MEPLVKVWHGTWFQLLLSTTLLLSMLLGWTSDICYVKTLVTLLHHVANVWQHDHPKVSLHNLKPYMCSLAWAGRIPHYSDHATYVAYAFPPDVIVTQSFTHCANISWKPGIKLTVQRHWPHILHCRPWRTLDLLYSIFKCLQEPSYDSSYRPSTSLTASATWQLWMSETWPKQHSWLMRLVIAKECRGKAF